ncbi:hypothetical protein IEO21_02424 [Rhodonia placenta]|uniref:Transcription activator of gluconeogenesis ERT1 n=2 Tax=Rhodonia placenta TaxID=104341 RepID=A0A1X6N8N8_9APHY|nr:hypothetical protein POSPLADRAFT_1065011 [Postia placenta MAD-698-R-SB12]KAF9818886.1 hypothetical protein IEO21_02424 [Postia placenta]OSX64971.1 hypothetical protein POSPLADRAFT_1065011 [Postia placenta MAD-698-R-SB12]
MVDNNPDAEGRQSPNSSQDSVQPQMTMHPVTYSSMPMHMYPFPPGSMPSQPARTKRRQVKNACTNCQKACKKCDDARPCLRCVKYGIAEECIDSQRKERQKGIKRGPYKKRDGKASGSEQLDNSSPQPGAMMPPPVAQPSAPSPIPYITPYPPFFGQYAPTHMPKAGEAPVYVPQLFYAPMPAPQPMPPPGHVGQDGEPAPAYAPPSFYPVYPAPYPPQAYAGAYMMHAPRPDGAMHHHPHHYAPYPQMYPKPPSRNSEVAGQVADGRRDPRLEPGRVIDGGHGHHGK